MRLNPENIIVEGADSCARTRRQYRSHLRPVREDLPGAWAHVEYPGKPTEQERPTDNPAMVGRGVAKQGTTGANQCKRSVGVGLFHSSEEAREGGSC